MGFDHRSRNGLAWLLIAFLFSGFGISCAYRPANQMTIRDFDGDSSYRKKVGVMTLANTTIFTSNQVAHPFMASFLSSMTDKMGDAILVLPGTVDAPPFLADPPRMAAGEIDGFTLSGLARQAGINIVVSPMLMDIRVRSKNTGFWFFRDVEHSLQIQTATALYDAITGSRLDLKILTDEVDIDDSEAEAIRSGQEIQVADLVEAAEEMGEKLGRRMGDAIEDSKWQGSVIVVADGGCVLPSGRDVGIEQGDRLAVLGVIGVISGLGEQRYVVPGTQIGDLTITQVDDQKSIGVPESGEPPPVGSIVIPLAQ